MIDGKNGARPADQTADRSGFGGSTGVASFRRSLQSKKWKIVQDDEE